MTQRAVYPFPAGDRPGLGIGLPAVSALVSLRWATVRATPLLVGMTGRRRSPTALMLVGTLVFTLGSLITAATGVLLGAMIGFGMPAIAKSMFDIGPRHSSPNPSRTPVGPGTLGSWRSPGQVAGGGGAGVRAVHRPLRLDDAVLLVGGLAGIVTLVLAVVARRGPVSREDDSSVEPRG